jgi:hypothetical protein
MPLPLYGGGIKTEKAIKSKTYSIKWSKRSTFTSIVVIPVHMQDFLSSNRHQSTENTFLKI